MAFNGDEFNSLKTKATTAKLKSLHSNVLRLTRKTPPLRGFAVKGKEKPELAVQFYNELVELLFDYIKTTDELTAEQKEHFMTWEKFQSSQKGPAAPVILDNIYEKVYEPIIHPDNITLSEHDKETCREVAHRFAEYMRPYVKIEFRSIDYEAAGRKLPGTTVRGFPYHSLGQDCDEDIIKNGGSSFKSAFKYFLLSSQLVTFPGGRIQGKPGPGPAKVRIVMIPCVYYQYLMVGIVDSLMTQAKKAAFFDGWKTPTERSLSISNMLEDAYRKGGVCIQLDFSAFDKNFAQFFRELTGSDVGFKLSTPSSDADAVFSQFVKYTSNQYIFLGSLEESIGRDWMCEYLPNQLVSGIKDTQSTGSTTNAIIQGFALKDAFNVDIDFELSRALGDDAVLPVPISIMTEYGYQGVLDKLAKSFRKIGFTVNPTKAYPNEDVAFLQKLYVPKLDIKGCGTGARSMASFLFKEKYSKEIPGINNLVALEIISQISILSEAFAIIGKDMRGFAKIFAAKGLEQDEGLRYIVQSLREMGSLDSNSFFMYLVKLTGLTTDQILEYNDALSYDHTGLLAKLQSSDYSKTFPIIPYILESEANRIPVRTKVQELFNSEDLVVSSQVDPDDLDSD